MRIGITFVVLLNCACCFSQLVLSFPEYKIAFRESNILYRGYDNILLFEVRKNKDSLALESADVSIDQSNNSSFIFRVSGMPKTIQVRARNCKTNQIEKVWNFQIMNLPSPTISWGIYEDGSNVSLDQTALRIDYGKTSLFEDPGFEVVDYEINSLLFEKPIRVSGGLITQDVIDALKKAKSLNEERPVLFGLMAKVRKKGEGVLRKKSAQFTF